MVYKFMYNNSVHVCYLCTCMHTDNDMEINVGGINYNYVLGILLHLSTNRDKAAK